MAIIGWVFLFLIMLYVTAVFVVICTQTLGKYNIGGVPTTVSGKVWTLIAGLLLILLWIKLFEWAPFTVTVVP